MTALHHLWAPFAPLSSCIPITVSGASGWSLLAFAVELLESDWLVVVSAPPDDCALDFISFYHPCLSLLKTHFCAFPTCSLWVSNLSFFVVACCLSVCPISPIGELENGREEAREGNWERGIERGGIAMRERTTMWRMNVRNSEGDAVVILIGCSEGFALKLGIGKFNCRRYELQF